MWRGLGVVSQPYLFVWWSVTLKIRDVLLPSSHQWQKLCFKTSETFDHTKSGCDVTNNSFLHQWTTLLACFHCTVHWSWQLACKPVSVWFGCSADKLDLSWTVLCLWQLCCLLCSGTTRLFHFLMIFSVARFLIYLFLYYHTTDLIILPALIWRILSFRF